MTDAKKLLERDNAQRAKFGWCTSSWIPPKLPKPETPTEKVIRKAFKKDLERVVEMHVYQIVEMLERAYDLGQEHAFRKF
jgi:hypothetical protein